MITTKKPDRISTGDAVTLNFSKIAKEAVPIKAGCYECDKTWSGDKSRIESAEHQETARHQVWVECRPKEDP